MTSCSAVRTDTGGCDTIAVTKPTGSAVDPPEPTTVGGRTIVVARHAKSDWGAGSADIDRPLAPRGRADAPVAGRWLATTVTAPDLVLVSPAIRTRQTWGLLQAASGFSSRVEVEPAIYLAEMGDLLGILAAVDDAVSSVMLVGHNPGSEDLVAHLTGSGEPAALEQLRAKFPTAAIAVLTVQGSWRDLAEGCAHLQHLVVPRAQG